MNEKTNNAEDFGSSDCYVDGPLAVSIPYSQLKAWSDLLDKANEKEVVFSRDQLEMANRVIASYDEICTEISLHIKTAIRGLHGLDEST